MSVGSDAGRGEICWVVLFGRLITGVLTRREVIIFLYERLSAVGKVGRMVATWSVWVAVSGGQDAHQPILHVVLLLYLGLFSPLPTELNIETSFLGHTILSIKRQHNPF